MGLGAKRNEAQTQMKDAILPSHAERADAFAEEARAVLSATTPAFDLKSIAARGRAEGLLSAAEAEQIELYSNFPEWLRARLMDGAARPERTLAQSQLLSPQTGDLAAPHGERPEGSILAGLKPVQVSSPPILRIDGGASVHHVGNFRRISWTSEGVIANMSDPRGRLFLPYLEASRPVALKGRSFLAVVEGASIFTHWMLDTLPRLLFVQQTEGSLDAYDHFVFATVHSKFHKATLDALGIDLSRVVTRDQVGTLFATETFTYVSAPRANFVAHDRVYDAVAGLFMDDFSPLPQTRRLYISRKKATRRRILNEDALMPLLERHRFEILHLEDMSIREAAATMRAASHVLAVHGAGLSNLIFAQPGTRVMELYSAHLSREYWVMANQRRLPYFGFEALGPDGAMLTESSRRRMSFFERNGLDMIAPVDRFTDFLENAFLSGS
jgi:hypothetical protein